jgi:hypothetical protein
MFILSPATIEILGRNRGLKTSEDFPLAALSTDTRHVVAYRYDLVLRSVVLAAGSVWLGLAIARINVPFAWLGILLFSVVLGGRFLWHAIQWMRSEEEVVLFNYESGQLAFEIFTDRRGDIEYATFISELKSAIGRAKDELNKAPEQARIERA